MTPFRKLYLNFYLLVYALYAYFNKGIAYSYLVEKLGMWGFKGVIACRQEKQEREVNQCVGSRKI